MTTAKKIIFRCDASVAMGSGHVMRCLTLADGLRVRGHDCFFWCGADALTTVPALAGAGYPIISDGFAADIMVVDHYGLNADDERQFRKFVSKIIVIDDLANRPHDADILIDTTLGRVQADYEGFVSPATKLLLGPQYAMLRPDFLRLRENAIAVRAARAGRVSRVMVAMGGTDPHNITSRVLDSLKGLEIAVDVVVGSSCPHIAAIEAKASELRAENIDIKIHRDAKNIHEIMLAADMAIGAGGTTSWERCCLGLPTLLIEVADNQRYIAKALSEQGCAINLGWHEDLTDSLIKQNILRLIQDSARVAVMSSNALGVCDGRGVDHIIPYVFIGNEKISLSFMTHDDCRMLFEWQLLPGTRRYAHNSATPSWKEHQDWFFAVLSNPARILYKILKDNKPVGMLRLDRIDGTTRKFLVSILIDPVFQGQGVAKAALDIAKNIDPAASFVAEVKRDNKASQRLFLSAGFTAITPEQFQWQGRAS